MDTILSRHWKLISHLMLGHHLRTNRGQPTQHWTVALICMDLSFDTRTSATLQASIATTQFSQPSVSLILVDVMLSRQCKLIAHLMLGHLQLCIHSYFTKSSQPTVSLIFVDVMLSRQCKLISHLILGHLQLCIHSYFTIISANSVVDPRDCHAISSMKAELS